MKYIVTGCKTPEEMKKADKAFNIDADLRKSAGADIAWRYDYATKTLGVTIPELTQEEKERGRDTGVEKLAAFGKVEVGADA